MEIVDTHTHVYLPQFDADRDAMIQRAFDAGVTRMILPGTEPESLPLMQKMKEQYPDSVFLAAGLHPTDLGENVEERLCMIEEALGTGRYMAVGEIGLDLYWDKSRLDEQMRVLDRQMRLAESMSLPVIIHCREALEPILEVIDGLDKVPMGVFHSFTGTPAEVDRVRSRSDFYFGINGVATFKNSNLADTIREITEDRLLLETDAPYLAPVPFRGKRNEPAYVVNTLGYVATTLGVDHSHVADVTSRNAEHLFSL